ncbi:MAG: magnesium transporter [Gammaproteobacteria bacterium]
MDPQRARSARSDALHEALDSGALTQVRGLVHALHPAEIADFLEALPPAQREIVWELVDTEDEGEILVALNEEVRATLIQEMDSEELVAAAAGLDLDDLADLFTELPETVNRELLKALDQSDRLRLEAVLSYDEDSAGGLMDPDTLTVRRDVTIEVVLRYLRMRGEIPEGTDAIFVVSRQGQYQGSLFITAMLTADPEKKVSSLMDTQSHAIEADTTAADVALIFEMHDLVSAAVVDETGKLLGRITIDDVVDVIRHEADHSVLSMAGLDEDDDMFAPVFVSAKRRSVWLGVNLATAFVAAGVAGLFESTLDRVVMLAILMPVVPSMGGIAGSQTLILITRGIALGQVESSNARWLLGKEFGVGLLNGLTWACVVAVVTMWWFQTWRIGLVIAIALAINLVCAAVAGFTIPLTLKKLNIDPALAGGVVLSTITDVVGLAAFLGFGALLLL